MISIFRDPIIDKYKQFENLKHLGDSKEFFDLQKYVANLIHQFSSNKKDFIFNPFIYRDLFHVIGMLIAHERNKSICSNYKKRFVTVAMCVDTIEDYFISEELAKKEYNVNILPGQPIRVTRNNLQDPNYKYQEHEIDAIFLGTNIYLDIKSTFNPYNQIRYFDSQNYAGLPVKTFKKYYNKVKSGEALDIWLLIYFNYNQYKADFNFINMKTLMKYIHEDNTGKITLISEVDNSNPFKKDINRKIIDINTDFEDHKIIFDFALCFAKGEFIDYMCSYYSNDIWL